MSRKYFGRFGGLGNGTPFEDYYRHLTRPGGPSREEARRDYESLIRDQNLMWTM